MTASHTQRVGQLVGGRYRILRFVAEGGMGVVYEAQHAVVKRRFAIKFLRPDLSTRRECLERFQREAEAAGAIDSQNIAAALDFGIAEDGSPFIVMEYLVGESLAALIERESRLPVGRAVDLVLQAARGIDAAHALQIVHRDLKPANLFLTRWEDGTDLVKVLDFGVAKLHAADQMSAPTCTGTVVGTACYMSPEQARGDALVDHRTDVYALASVLYELLSGHRPHPGSSYNAVLHHTSTQPAMPLDAVRPGLPTPLVDVIHRALSSEPDARPRSAADLCRALEPFAQREPWPEAQTRGDVQVSSTAPVAASERRDLTMTPPGRRRSFRNRRAALLAALVAAVLAAGAMRLGSKAHDTSRPPSRRPELAHDTRFYVPRPNEGAVAQIAALSKAGSFREAAALTEMITAPQGVWFEGGSPEETRSRMRNVMAQAGRDQSVPVLVVYNLPHRDCVQASAGGAINGAAYEAWIDALVEGIGTAKAVVILEPDGLGLIPYNRTLKGVLEWCRPTAANAEGDAIAAPEATAARRYELLDHAVEAFAQRAPNALVYLDGTHARWLPVGEAAYRLVRAGIAKARGFFLNLGSFHRTDESIQFGTWISKCIQYVMGAPGRGTVQRFTRCATHDPAAVPDPAAWAKTDRWYAENVDAKLEGPQALAVLAHFVIDTSRNGQGRFVAARYAAPPYNQPPEVTRKLEAGHWCNPPRAGLGLRPTADTGVALLDAYVWAKVPGESDGSCDVAGGARAWDYSRYNPWGLEGDAQKHFDPLWNRVDPGPGAWFPEQALELALKAEPPLFASP